MIFETCVCVCVCVLEWVDEVWEAWENKKAKEISSRKYVQNKSNCSKHKGGIIQFDIRVEGRVKWEKEGLKRWVEFSHSIGKGGAEETESPKPRRLKQKGKRELLENGEYLSTTGLLYYSKGILGWHNRGRSLVINGSRTTWMLELF